MSVNMSQEHLERENEACMLHYTLTVSVSVESCSVWTQRNMYRPYTNADNRRRSGTMKVVSRWLLHEIL